MAESASPNSMSAYGLGHQAFNVAHMFDSWPKIVHWNIHPSTETGGLKWQQLHQVLAVTSHHESDLSSKCWFPHVSFIKLPSIYRKRRSCYGPNLNNRFPNVSKAPRQFCDPIVQIETLEPPQKMRSNFSTDSIIATKPHLFHKPCTQASSVNILLPSRGNVQDASHDPTGWSAAAWISAARLWENSRSWHRCIKDAWLRDMIFFAHCSKNRIQIQTVNVFGFSILVLSN